MTIQMTADFSFEIRRGQKKVAQHVSSNEMKELVMMNPVSRKTNKFSEMRNWCIYI